MNTSDQPFALSPDEELQLFSLLNPADGIPQWNAGVREKKINYCKHCFIQFDKKASYTDHIRSLHQKKAKIGLGSGTFVVTVQRTGDGHFYCPCGGFKTAHPKPLACHMRRCAAALSLDPNVKDSDSFTYPPTIFPALTHSAVNIGDWNETSEVSGGLAESA